MMKEIELINFIDLTIDEKMMVLSWRNDYRIREWMYDSEIISKERHLNFINNLARETDKLYFLVKDKNRFLGVIDFTKIKYNKAHMGIYLNPEIKGKGEILLDTIISYGTSIIKLNIIIAEVYSQNTKAIELYKSKNFEIIGKKLFKGKKIFIMERKNENC